jgi:hypothetical protein
MGSTAQGRVTMRHEVIMAAGIIFGMLPTMSIAQPRINCGELQRACAMKEQLGEKGEGNCRRFRQLCGDVDVRQRQCVELRRACLNKDRLGERGEGNCRRYREVCR